MKLIQLMKRGPNKLLCGVSFTSASMDPDTKKTRTISLWLAPHDGELSRYRVEMDRMDAMRLRDNLNLWFPETEFYDGV